MKANLWLAPRECLWHHLHSIMLFLLSCISHSCVHLPRPLKQLLFYASFSCVFSFVSASLGLGFLLWGGGENLAPTSLKILSSEATLWTMWHVIGNAEWWKQPNRKHLKLIAISPSAPLPGTTLQISKCIRFFFAPQPQWVQSTFKHFQGLAEWNCDSSAHHQWENSWHI